MRFWFGPGSSWIPAGSRSPWNRTGFVRVLGLGVAWAGSLVRVALGEFLVTM